MRRNLGRLRFKEDDPLRYLHAPRRQRKTTDEGDHSDATDEITGEADDDFDRDEVRARGDVVPAAELQ